MKKLLMLLILISSLSVSSVKAQDTRVEHLWVDSLSVTSAVVDTTFPVKWNQASLVFSGVTGLVRLCGPDTAVTADRKWLILTPGAVVEIGPKTGLKRLQYKSESGNGALFITGYKYRYIQVSR